MHGSHSETSANKDSKRSILFKVLYVMWRHLHTVKRMNSCLFVCDFFCMHEADALYFSRPNGGVTEKQRKLEKLPSAS